MPFKSEAQRGFMYANHPKLAKEFEAATPDGKLPEHVEKMSDGGMACKHCGGAVDADGYSDGGEIQSEEHALPEEVDGPTGQVDEQERLRAFANELGRRK